MDLEQIRQDFKDGKMISKCTWALVLEAMADMEKTLDTLAKEQVSVYVNTVSSNCLGRVAAL